MKTLNNFRIDNKFEEIIISQVTICVPSTAVYKLTLPIDDGISGQVLTTDGEGVTSWTTDGGGTVTSVAATVPTFLNISGSPITTSGTLAIGLSGSALPTANGGTGSTAASTGTGGVVLSNAPTLTGTTNLDTLILTNALAVTSGGTGSTSASTGTGGVVLATNPTFETRITVNGVQDAFHEFKGNNQTIQINDDSTSESTQITTVRGANFFCGGSIAGDTVIRNASGTKNMLFCAGPSGPGPQLYLKSDGKVGVGNFDPTTDFDVTGDIGTDSMTIRGGTNEVTLKGASTSDYDFTFPPNGGTAGFILETNGTGGTAWRVEAGGGGGGGTVTSVVLDFAANNTIFNSSTAITSNQVPTMSYSGEFLPISSGGTGTGSSTGTGGVVLLNSPTIAGLTGTGTTNLATLTLTNALAVTSGGTGVTTSTGSGANVLGTAPTINNLTGTGTSTFTNTLSTIDVTSPTLKLTQGAFTNSIITQATEDWTLALPVDGGSVGQVLVTDGAGVTTWAGTGGLGTVTSVAATVPAFLTISGSPITSSGTLAIGLSSTALPTSSGGTGSITASTGTGGVVLSTSPTFIADITVNGSTSAFHQFTGTNQTIEIFSGTESTQISTVSGANFFCQGSVPGDTVIRNSSATRNILMVAGNSALGPQVYLDVGGNVGIRNLSPTSTLDVTGTLAVSSSMTANSLSLTTALPVASGGTGTGSSTGTGGVVLSTSPSISAPTLSGVTAHTGNIVMDDNEILLRTDANHGLVYDSVVDGPNLFGFTKGRLSTGVGGGDGRMWYDTNGISTNNSDFFKYTESSWTPTWGGAGSVTYHERSGHYVKCGQQTTVFFELRITVTGAGSNVDVLFTGLGLTNPLSSFQRCNISFADVPIAQPQPMNLTIQNGATDLLLFNGANVRVQTNVTGGFTGTFYSVFSYIST